MMIRGKVEVRNKIRDLEYNELQDRIRKLRGRRLVINEAWRRVRKNRGKIKRRILDISEKLLGFDR